MNRVYKSTKREKPVSPLVSYWRRLDKPLILAALLCSLLSIILLYSIWQNHIISSVGASYYRTQLLSCGLGMVCLLVLSAIDYHKIVRLWFLYAPIALVLTLLTFTALGHRRAGADDQAWLNLGFIQFQPSEVLKLAFILTFSLHLAKDEGNMNKPLHMLLLCVHGAIPTGLIALQGDYGTAIGLCGDLPGNALCRKDFLEVCAGISDRHSGGAGRCMELPAGRHPQKAYPGTAPPRHRPGKYRVPAGPRGLEALSNGKIFGAGLHAGKENYVSVPEIHNDFMFAQVGQALGFVGAVAVILVLTFLCLKILYDGFRTKDKMGMFLCTGVFSMLFIHCVMNIGMVLKVAPVIGVPLPFISAGGTATVSMYIALGLVVSAYGHNDKKYRVFD